MAKKRRRCVVTGACGFIGSHMVEKLWADGQDVVASDHPRALEPANPIQEMNLALVKEKAKEFIVADVSVPGALDDVVDGADYIFHIASVFSYSAPWDTLYKVNVKGTVNLIESVVRKSPPLKRLVVWGAGGIYGLPTPERIPFTEDTPPDPPNNYQRSKWFEEFVTMQRCAREGIPYSIVRPTTVYGTRQLYGVPDFLRSVYKAKLVVIPGNLTGRVPLVHVDDVCGAAMHVARYQSGLNQVFNVNDDSRLALLTVFRFLAQVFGKPFVVLPDVPLGPVRTIVKGLGYAAEFFARKAGVRPPLEKDTVDMLGADFVFSNAKLKAAGYELKYPDPKPAIIEVARWYVENGLL